MQSHVQDLSLGVAVMESRKQAAMTLELGSCEDNHDHMAMCMPIQDHKAPKLLPISLKFVDVTYKVSIKKSSLSLRSQTLFEKKAVEKEILHNVTGYVLPGEMLALMGPSGSGKTTLVNLLSGRRNANQEGTITYNDLPHSKTLKQRMGFVMQDDILYPHLTVKETLTYAALLRLPKTMYKKEKQERAMEVIHQLGLQRCQDTMIGGPFMRGISGGERKRVCVGHEILIDPSLLFLDEPTSGLDSTTALRIVQMLRELSGVGRTVVTTIHQPSSRLFYMFDKLILLSEGQVIYFGKAGVAMDYFSSIGFSPLIAMNPADFLLDLASGNLADMSIPVELNQKVVSASKDDNAILTQVSKEYLSDSYENTLLPIERSKLLEMSVSIELKKRVSTKREWSSSWWLQFNVLCMRGLRERRHEYLSSLQISQVVASSLIVGSLWWNSDLKTEKDVADQVGLVFFISTFWGFFPLFTALFTFPQERVILAKERASDMYRLSAYFMARTLSDALLDLCLPVVFVLIVYFMTHLQQTPSAFFLTLLTIFLSATTAQGLGIAIGAAMMDVKKATTLASVILLTFMLAGGYFVEHLPSFISWIKYISYNYYTFELLVKIQYNKGQQYNCNAPTGCQSIALSPAIHDIPLGGGVKEASILLAMAVGYHLLGYIFLRRMRLGV